MQSVKTCFARSGFSRTKNWKLSAHASAAFMAWLPFSLNKSVRMSSGMCIASPPSDSYKVCARHFAQFVSVGIYEYAPRLIAMWNDWEPIPSDNGCVVLKFYVAH